MRCLPSNLQISPHTSSTKSYTYYRWVREQDRMTILYVFAPCSPLLVLGARGKQTHDNTPIRFLTCTNILLALTYVCT